MNIPTQPDTLPFNVTSAREAYELIVEGVRFRVNAIDWESAGVGADETEARIGLFDAIMPTILHKSGVGFNIGFAERIGEPDPDDLHGYQVEEDSWFYVEQLPISGEKATYLRNWLWVKSIEGTEMIMGADRAKVASMLEFNFGNTWRQAIDSVRTYRIKNNISGSGL